MKRGFSLIELLISIAIASVGIGIALTEVAHIHRAADVARSDSVLIFTAQHIERSIRAAAREDALFLLHSDSENVLRNLLDPLLPTGVSVQEIHTTSLPVSDPLYATTVTHISIILSTGLPVRELPLVLYIDAPL